MSYMEGLSGDFSLAKDIRIFGLRPWMDEVYDKAMKTYEALIEKAENKILRARIIDLVLTFLRNAAAYAYLIRLVLGNELCVAEFLLYFSTVGGFTSWITGIFGGFRTLHKNSLDIGTIREFLEYEELFRFEEGERLTAEKGKEYEIRLQGVSFRYPEARKYASKYQSYFSSRGKTCDCRSERSGEDNTCEIALRTFGSYRGYSYDSGSI